MDPVEFMIPSMSSSPPPSSSSSLSVSTDPSITSVESPVIVTPDSASAASSEDFVPSVGPPSSYSSRLLHFHHSLNSPLLPLSSLQSFIEEYGTPSSSSDNNLRSLLWKILLGYLPLDRGRWEISLRESRNTYEQFVNELTVNPYSKIYKEREGEAEAGGGGGSSGGSGRGEKVNIGDDPLSAANNEWSQYYKDEEIRKEIQKDVARTYSSFSFFNERVKPIETTKEAVKEMDKQAKEEAVKEEAKAAALNAAASLSSLSSSHSPSSFTLNGHTLSPSSPQNLFDSLPAYTFSYPSIYVSPPPKRSDEETHHDVLRRVLFIYARLNPGVKYIQGMNELLAPIYYVFARDTSSLFKDHAEADAFFCFTQLMSEVRDRFIKSLDSSSTGILAVVKELNLFLKELDEELWIHLENNGVDPRFYSFRWLTLLLSQEYELPEVLRLWDSLFADPQRFLLLLFMCCSMIILVREKLLEGEFADILRILQHYQEEGVGFDRVLREAIKMKKEYLKKKEEQKEAKQRERERSAGGAEQRVASNKDKERTRSVISTSTNRSTSPLSSSSFSSSSTSDHNSDGGMQLSSTSINRSSSNNKATTATPARSPSSSSSTSSIFDSIEKFFKK